MEKAGADVIAQPRPTPFKSINARLAGPAGLHLTLFQKVSDPAVSKDARRGQSSKAAARRLSGFRAAADLLGSYGSAGLLAGEEFLYLAGEVIHILEEKRMPGVGIEDGLRIGRLVSDDKSAVRWDHCILRAVRDENRQLQLLEPIPSAPDIPFLD